MDHFRKLGLVCLIVTAALAVAGVGTAAAEQSTLCKTNETPCSSGNHYPSGTEVLLTAKTGIKWVSLFKGEPLLTYECKSAEYRGKTSTTGSGSEAVEIAISTQFFSSCNCPFTVLKLPKMKVNWTSGTMNGSVTSSGPEMSFTCFGMTCAYGGELKEGITLTGGSPAVLAFKEVSVPRTNGGVLCGTEAKLNAEFEVEKPSPLYVSSA